MTKILALDVATNTGWAVWETDRSPSAMLTGCFHCDGEGKGSAARSGKRDDMRRKLRALIKLHQPDVAVIETPLQVIKTYQKAKPKKGDMLASIAPVEDEGGGGGPNANVVLTLNQLFAVAWDVCRGTLGASVYEVDPKTWQTITKSYPGGTKARSIEACRVLRVEIPKAKAQQDNAADAAMIALWSAGNLQQIKLIERTKEKAA